MLPVDEVRIDPVKVNDIGLGKSIYTQQQLDEFARFQDSQGTRKAYLAEKPPGECKQISKKLSKKPFVASIRLLNNC
jgi:hypothetical protein